MAPREESKSHGSKQVELLYARASRSEMIDDHSLSTFFFWYSLYLLSPYDMSRRADAPMYSVASFILSHLLWPSVWHEPHSYPVDLEGMNLRNLMDFLNGV